MGQKYGVPSKYESTALCLLIMISQIGKRLTEAWLKLAEFTATYAQLFLKCPDPVVKANKAALNAWKKTWVAQISV